MSIPTFDSVRGIPLTTDRVWLRSLRMSCEQAEVDFRGPFLCHRDGVRVISPGECRPTELSTSLERMF